VGRGRRVALALPLLTATAIVAGAVAHLLDAPRAGDTVWAAAVAVALVPLTASVASSLRRGDVGVDAIALLAMAGALALGELLAGAVIALMLAGGNALEAAASGRARRELTALLQRAPRTAHRRRGGGVEGPRRSRRPTSVSRWPAPGRPSRPRRPTW
jgi:cation transport ATPase